MEESILTSIKKLLGVGEEDIHFDNDITMHINSVLFVLNQIGVGPAEGFSISDKIKEWKDYLPNILMYEAVKSYMYLKVRLIFDPPISNALIEIMKSQADEYEWRLMVSADPKIVIVEEVNT